MFARLASFRWLAIDRLLAGWLSVLLIAGISVAEEEKPSATESFDLLIRNGRVVDGCGGPWYRADLGIRNGRIVAMGRLSGASADEMLDAQDLIVAPGMIDMMGQTASPMLRDPRTAHNLLTQGITTINAGEGASAAPLDDEDARRKGWQTMAEYFAMVDSRGLPVNLVQSVGHTQVRRIVLGEIDRRPFPDELDAMQRLVEEAMQAGAIGVSTALIYPPAVYADVEEIAALAEVAGRYGGGYFTHMRNEGDRLLEAIDEAFEIGRRGNCPVHIFHLKAAGQDNWGKMPLALARIQAARHQGMQVTADIYPYINNGLGIAALIDPRHFSEGAGVVIDQLDDPEFRAKVRKEMEHEAGWENWYRHAGRYWNRIVVGRSNVDRYASHDGESVKQISEAVGEDPWETFFELVRGEAFVLPQTMSEANKIAAMQQPFISFCTDVGPAGGASSTSHPRGYGSFPRLLGRYVRELGAIPLERAVAQASAVAAGDLRIFDRGRLAEGLAADVIVFDPDTITDNATFRDADAVSSGVLHVIVNGQLVLRNGEMTDALPGRVLRGPGYDPSQAAYRQANGPADPDFASFDHRAAEILRDHHVPGMAAAVADQGNLLYSRGYGYADIGAGEPVTPESLFRIASISKPITAVAILQLVECGKLQLDTPVLEVLDLEQEIAAAGDAFDARFRKVTVRQLLQHRAGWDRDHSLDPMFQSVQFAEQLGVEPPADASTVISAMLRRPLDCDPGERYAYSNFGYCLLGRVIETVSGKDYETYVKTNVLAPLGIESMRLGRSRLSHRAENEVRYYHPMPASSVFAEDLGEETPSPYGGWNLEAMDAHGGWLATASDLARFASAFDDPENCPILSAASIEQMYARPSLAEDSEREDSESQPKGDEKSGDSDDSYYYSLGWSNRVVGPDRINHWHTGSLPGTTAILIRRHDGKTLVALANTRVTPGKVGLGTVLDRYLHAAANAVTEWPETNSESGKQNEGPASDPSGNDSEDPTAADDENAEGVPGNGENE